jgi:hypothetical protein
LLWNVPVDNSDAFISGHKIATSCPLELETVQQK